MRPMVSLGFLATTGGSGERAKQLLPFLENDVAVLV